MALTGMLLLVAALLPAPDPREHRWQWPSRPPPKVLRGFEPPAHPWEAGHRGVDLATRPGQPVYAAGPGRVGYARDLAGRGVITVVHGALRTTYLPVRPAVRVGQIVTAGARIGVVENLLGHCGQTSCLHWGLLRGVSYLDPLTLLGLGPVRLLPWWNTSRPYEAGRPRRPPDAPAAGPPRPGTVPPARPGAGGRPDTGRTGPAERGRPPGRPPMRLAGATAAAGGAAGLVGLAALLCGGLGGVRRRARRLFRARECALTEGTQDVAPGRSGRTCSSPSWPGRPPPPGGGRGRP